MRHRNASSSECPRHHQRKLFSPEYATVRTSPLIHGDIRICIAQRVRPPPCVLEEERLLCAGDKVCARKRTRHNARRLVTAAPASSPPAETPNTAVRSVGSATPNRDSVHRRTSSTRNFSCAATRSIRSTIKSSMAPSRLAGASSARLKAR
jgi:hypothetical protein